MADSRLIPVDDLEEWRSALACCGDFSIYQTAAYHLLAKGQNEGEPFLHVFQNEDGAAALPFLLREIAAVPGLEDCRGRDATSAYGYPGIVASIPQDHPRAAAFRSDFQKSLTRLFDASEVVAFFGRLNPLIPTAWLFEGLGQVSPLSRTVAIDLTLPDRDQTKEMTKGHRYDLRKARESGVTVREDRDFAHLDDFVRMYEDTMKRTGAQDYYFFTPEYFLRLKPLFGEAIRLFLAEKAGSVISASLFFISGSVIQYHLSGTPEAFLAEGGSKVILDEVRLWGSRSGFKWLHLGGGVGSQEDSLFRFKAGFSKLRFPFEIVKMILQPALYDDIVGKHETWLAGRKLMRLSGSYFPAYRAAAKPREGTAGVKEGSQEPKRGVPHDSE